MKIKNLHDLFASELRCIYSAEKQILKALPKLARAAGREELRAAFQEHLEQTRNQVTRLESVFEELDQKPRGKTCEALEGLAADGEELIDKTADPATLDAGLIAAAQKVEHFEIASYGCLIAWARQLGLEKAPELLQQTLAEEEETDRKLTSLAESKVNQEAPQPNRPAEAPRRQASEAMADEFHPREAEASEVTV